MVADGSCGRKAAEIFRIEKSGIFSLADARLVLIRFVVDLIACGQKEGGIRCFSHSACQCFLPTKCIRGDAARGADLGIAC